MTEFAKEILAVSIEDELRTSYLDYAMSVIVGRALPDVRDGLKPVHRRVLYAMNVLGNDYNKAYKKSARVVGDVIGKYHPHGDTAVYDTIVRMAQPFSLRYVLVDGQGNFGSIDGDNAAAMRYTEVRMTKLSHELLADLDKETVDFVDNYDGSESEPSVLPTRVPNLLINGSAGIAVGMATNIPPHNLREVIDGVLAVMDTPEIDVTGLMEYIPAPDFPTAGLICGRAGIVEAYKHGRGRCVMRARWNIEDAEKGEKQSIIITEIPFQVNKARVIEKIAELVKDKEIEGITALRDESDKDGMRIVIELRRGELPDVVMNNLFQKTQLQSTFGINMVALVDGQPKTLGLKEILECFITHRREVVTRRTVYELREARKKAHVLEGLTVALANIDEIIALIKKSPTPQEARESLIAKEWRPGQVTEMLSRAGADASRPETLEAEFGLHGAIYRLSPAQAQAILDLRLQKLTGLEHEKILEEFKELLVEIAEFLNILGSNERLMQVIRGELEAIREEYGDERRTEITTTAEDINIEDLIADEPVVVTLSNAGYVKYQPLTTYEAQRRGGRGKSATDLKDEDFVHKLLVCQTHDTLLCFSTRGKLYWLKVYELPEAGRNARGKPIVNMLPLEANEKITSMLPVREYNPEKQVFMATKNGVVKRTSLENFSRPRTAGIIAVDLDENDALIGADITNGSDEVMLFSDAGRVVRFKEDEVREMGRLARGVRGIRLPEGGCVVSLVVAQEGGEILTSTENGYGKRTAMSEYPVKGRGIQGVISIQVSERNGKVIGAVAVKSGDHIMLISDQGTLIRSRADEVRVMGRNTQGVRLMRMQENEKLAGLECIVHVGDDDVEETTALLHEEPEEISGEPLNDDED